MGINLTQAHNDAAVELLNVHIALIKDASGSFDGEILFASQGCLAGQQMLKTALGEGLLQFPEGQTVLSEAVNGAEELWQFFKWCCAQMRIEAHPGSHRILEKEHAWFEYILKLNTRADNGVEQAFLRNSIPSPERPYVCLLAAAKGIEMMQGDREPMDAIQLVGKTLATGLHTIPYRNPG